MKNFNEENIPDIDEIFSKIQKELSDFKKIKKFTFNELFIKTNRNEFSTNLVLIKKYYENFITDNDFKGLYIFYENDIAIYVGISKKILRRIKQHFLSNSHFSASLVYLIAREKHDESIGFYNDDRENFPFENYREEIQNNMRNNWKISLLSENDNYILYLKEIYISCKLKTYWNSFATH